MKLKIWENNPVYFFLLLFSAQSMASSSFITLHLSCAFYDENEQGIDDSIWQVGLPWVWAKGLKGEQIYLHGQVEDGFFVVKKMVGKSRGLFGLSVRAQYKNSLGVARKLCERGIAHAHKNSEKGLRLLKISAKSSFLSLSEYPIVFKSPMRNKSVDRMVVFGDSMSDEGNLKNWLRVFPKRPYFAGRFSNGPIWVDYLRQLSDLAIQNWAVAGSVSRLTDSDNYKTKKIDLYTAFENKTRDTLTGSMNDEIKRFKKTSLGENGRILNPESTLFFLWIGGNDYFYKLESAYEVDHFLDSPYDEAVGYKVVVDRTTQNIIDAMEELYQLGARKFAVSNVPDLGIVPKIPENTTYHSDSDEPYSARILQLSKKMTKVGRRHNRILAKKIRAFEREKNIEVKVVNANLGFDKAMRQESFTGEEKINYGVNYENFKIIRYKKQERSFPKACYKGGGLVTKMEAVCEHPNETLFWDSVHPTTNAHCLLGYFFHRNFSDYGWINEQSLSEYFRICRPDLLKQF